LLEGGETEGFPATGFPATQSKPNKSGENPYEKALEIGYDAAVLAQDAENSEEWSKVASTWHVAIELLLKALTRAREKDRDVIQAKIDEYRHNYDVAQRQHVQVTDWIPQDFVQFHGINQGNNPVPIAYRRMDSQEYDCPYSNCWGIEAISRDECNYLSISLTSLSEKNMPEMYSYERKEVPESSDKTRFILDQGEDAKQMRIQEMQCDQ